jgi:hypothetical protein
LTVVLGGAGTAVAPAFVLSPATALADVSAWNGAALAGSASKKESRKERRRRSERFLRIMVADLR